MKTINSKEVKLSDLKQYAETTEINGMSFTVFKFYRVTKHSGLKIMFARVGDKIYGGMRYENESEEDILGYLANLYKDGYLQDESDQIRYHENLGRKIEELDKTLLLGDFQLQ